MNKTYHLRSPFEMYGSFAKPNSDSSSFTGRLARTKNGIELISSPVLKEPDPLGFLGSVEKFTHLHGRTTEGPCTLYYLLSSHSSGLTDFSAGHSITFRHYRVSFCAFGLHLPPFDAPFDGSVTFSFTGLHEWISLSPRISEIDHQTVLTYESDYPAVFDVSSRTSKFRMKLDIVPLLQHRASGEHSARNESRLLIEPSRPQSLDWYLQLGYRLEHLFSLFLGTVVMKTVTIKHEDKIGFLVRKTNHKAEKPDPSIWIRCGHSQLTNAVLSWLDVTEQFRSVENLIYGTIQHSSLFVETEFLSLAQALESFHRVTDASTISDRDSFRQVLQELRLKIASCCKNAELAGRINDSIRYANEPSFKTRITQLLARLPEDQRKKLIGDEVEFEMTLRSTRNHLTHPGIDKKPKVLTDVGDVFLFNQKLHALLRYLMLTYVGLQADQIFEPVFRQATKMTVI